MTLDQLLTKEELQEFLKPRGITLVEKEGWPKHGTFNIAYLAEEKIPGSTDSSAKYVVKVPQSREVVRAKKRIYTGVEGISQNTLNKNAKVKQKKLRHPQIPSSEIIQENINGKQIEYILEDYAPGYTLDELVELPAYKNLPYTKKRDFVINLMIEYTKLIDFLENKGISHNDLKPENLKVEYTDENQAEPKVYILDLNVSKDKDSKEKYFGSDFFSAPERIAPKIKNEEYNLAFLSDQFSLGLIAQYLLYGKTHVDPKDKTKENRIKSIEILMNEEEFKKNQPIYSETQKSLKKIISKMTEYEPNKRYTNFEHLLDDFKEIRPGIKKNRFWKNIKEMTATVATLLILYNSGNILKGWVEYNNHIIRESMEATHDFETILKTYSEGTILSVDLRTTRLINEQTIHGRYDNKSLLLKPFISQVEKSSQISIGLFKDDKIWEYLIPCRNFGITAIENKNVNLSQKKIPYENIFIFDSNWGAFSFKVNFSENGESMKIRELQLSRPFNLHSTIGFIPSPEICTDIYSNKMIKLELTPCIYSLKKVGFVDHPKYKINFDNISKLKENEKNEYYKDLAKMPTSEKISILDFIAIKYFDKEPTLEEYMKKGYYPIYEVYEEKVKLIEKPKIIWEYEIINYNSKKFVTEKELFTYKELIENDGDNSDLTRQIYLEHAENRTLCVRAKILKEYNQDPDIINWTFICSPKPK